MYGQVTACYIRSLGYMETTIWLAESFHTIAFLLKYAVATIIGSVARL